MIDIETVDAETVRQRVKDDDSLRKEFLHAIRRLFADGRKAVFESWNVEADDSELFRFARIKRYPHQDVTAAEAEAEREFDDWRYRRRAPLHLCEYFIVALKERKALAF